MDQFQMDHQALYHLLKIKCERETLDDILQGMRTLLADEAMPTAEQVRAFLQAPDGDTALDPQQQMVAMDQMLQCMEVNFRTCCDLLRYQQMKKGIRRKNRMKVSEYKSYKDLPLFLNAEIVSKVLGIAPSSAYELLHEKDFPSLRIGNRIVVPKEPFIQWVDAHTGGNG